MSWRQLLTLAYALLVEGFNADQRAEVDLTLEGQDSPRAFRDELAFALRAGEVA